MFFSTQKHLTQKFLQTDFFARRNFTQSSFYTAFVRTETLQFLQTDGFYIHTESSPHRSLTHRRFYAQHFSHTDVFTHRCLYTDTNCTQKLVHKTRLYNPLHTTIFYTEPLFPLLDHLPSRVPPLKSSSSSSSPSSSSSSSSSQSSSPPPPPRGSHLPLNHLGSHLPLNEGG